MRRIPACRPACVYLDGVHFVLEAHEEEAPAGRVPSVSIILMRALASRFLPARRPLKSGRNLLRREPVGLRLAVAERVRRDPASSR